MEWSIDNIINQLPTATWCPQILTGLSIQSDGLAPCCEYADRRIKVQSVDEYKKSAEYQQLLANMNAGKWSKACSTCKSREEAGQLSQRLKEVKNHLAALEIYDKIDTDAIIEVSKQDQFLWLNLQPTNKCNQACIMCWHGSSSKLEEEVKKHKDKHWLNHKKVNFHKWDNWPEIAKHKHPDGRIYLSGGEPSIMKDVIQYLDSIKNPEDIQIDLNSNFHSFNKHFISILKRFKKIYMLASIDAVGQQYEYVRYLGNWNNTEKNILQARDNLPNANIFVSPTWTLVNSWQADVLAKWCNTHNLAAQITNVSFSNPIFITNLEPSWKDRLKNTFLATNWTITNTKQINEIVSVIDNSNFDVKKFISFKKYLASIDNVRNLNYRKVFPILDEYIQDVSNKYSC